MFRVIIVGGRDFSDYELLKTTMEKLLANIAEVSSARDEEEEAMENMPESLQGSDGVLNKAVDLFDELTDKLREIDGVG